MGAAVSDYKDAWNERYCELAMELFEKDYWDCSKDQLKILNDRINGVMADWVADHIDAAKDRAKYGGL